MLRPRIIPCLLIQDGGLVKTVRFKDPKYVGDPINAVKIFNEKEADELIVLDIDASVKGVEPNYKQIANLAAECRMPLCYGGGIRTAEQAKKIISLGVEKVAISSAALNDPMLITRIAEEIGRQSVVVVLDHKHRMLSKSQDVGFTMAHAIPSAAFWTLRWRCRHWAPARLLSTPLRTTVGCRVMTSLWLQS
jgi:cyclase